MNHVSVFPFLLGGAFIEASTPTFFRKKRINFPSFLEGLSLRHTQGYRIVDTEYEFPFLLGGAFIEASHRRESLAWSVHFPSFLEGLSLRLRVHRDRAR